MVRTVATRAQRDPHITGNAWLAWLMWGVVLLPACGDPVLYSRIDVQSPDGGTDVPQQPGDGSSGDADDGGDSAPDSADDSADDGADDDGGDQGMGGRGDIDGATDDGGTPDGSDDATGAGGGTGTGGMSGTGGVIGTDGGIGTGGVTGSGGVTGTGGAGLGGSPGTGGGPDLAQYNFEATAQGWAAVGAWTGFGRSTAQRFAGLASVGGIVTYTPVTGVVSTTQELFVLPAAGTGPVAGNVVTFHIFLPTNAGPAATPVVIAVQPYMQDSGATPGFFATYTAANTLVFGDWTTITVPLPPTIVPPISRVAVQIFTGGPTAFTGGIYVDSISW
jgi:hypothetical protein